MFEIDNKQSKLKQTNIRSIKKKKITIINKSSYIESSLQTILNESQLAWADKTVSKEVLLLQVDTDKIPEETAEYINTSCLININPIQINYFF